MTSSYFSENSFDLTAPLKALENPERFPDLTLRTAGLDYYVIVINNPRISVV